jgi:hypothetical protein
LKNCAALLRILEVQVPRVITNPLRLTESNELSRGSSHLS